MTAHAHKDDEDVLVAGDQDGADLAQGDGGTMQVASAGTGVGDVGVQGVDPRGLLAFSRIVENLNKNVT